MRNEGRQAAPRPSFPPPYSSSLIPSQRRFAALAGADAHGIVKVTEEDLAVADLAGAPGLHDRRDHRFRLLIGHHQLELHLGEEADLVLHAPVPLDIAALAA